MRVRTFVGSVAAIIAATVLIPVSSQASVYPMAPLTADFVKTCEVLPAHAGDSAVVWSIEQSGNKVYVAGSFDKVRCPDGTVVDRDNVAVLTADSKHVLPEQYQFGGITQYSSTPDVNCKIDNWNVSVKSYVCDTVYQVKNGPNGSVYFAGAFTTVNGQPRSRIAQALNGGLTGFRTADINGNVRALVIHGALYAGGEFTKVGNPARIRLSAFNATSGGLYGWQASADRRVLSLIASPDGYKLFVGGDFSHINSAYAPRIGAVSLANGSNFAGWKFKWNNTYHETNSRVTSFASDGKYIYFGAEGDGPGFDGRKKLDSNGNTIWTDYCQGATWAVDVYSNYLASGSHAHSCGQTPGGFPNIADLKNCLPQNTCRWQRVLIQNKDTSYIYHFFPQINGGEYGPKEHFPSRLGPRAVKFIHNGNGVYLLVGGQQTVVNGQLQRGLAAFGHSVKSYIPNKPPVPLLTRVSAGISVVVRTTEDYDDRVLTYKVYRNGVLVGKGNASSGPGLAQKFTVLDKTSVDKVAHGSYVITASDSRGNAVASDAAAI